MIIIKKYYPKLSKDWDLFITKSNNGTIFQTQKFINYHINRSFIDHSLIFLVNNKIVALFPACEIAQNKGITLYSHPGSSYGGFVLKPNLAYDIINEILLAFDDYCISHKLNSTIFIQSPDIYCNKFDFSLNYCLKWNNFKETETYLSHVTNIKNSNNIGSLLNKRKKRYINKLDTSKTFIIKDTDDFKSFYPILLESKKNYDILPTHSLDELIKIKHLFKNNIILLLSYDGPLVVGGTLVFITNVHIGLIFYNVVLDKYKNSQLASYQFYKAMQLCKNRNLHYVDFGVSHIPQHKNPLTPKLSLIRFKEQFGAIGIMRHIYKKDYKFGK